VTPELRAGILVTRRHPGYKDVPGVRYHYPKRNYHQQVQRLVGALVLFYEPRRGGASAAALHGGRSAFTGFAFIDSVRDDPDDSTHAYAEFRYSLDFNTPVPLRLTSLSGPALQSAVMAISSAEAERIVGLGLALAPNSTGGIPRNGLSDVDDLIDIAKRPLVEVVRNGRVRDASFRYQVVERVYAGRCALTGIRMTNGHGRAEADAAHIRPVANDGPDIVRNGIALTKSVHWAFDRGFVSLSDDGQILAVERGIDRSIRGLLQADGRALLPAKLDERPHPAFLKWHRDHVFKGAA